jgi:hypothetical protein
MRPEAKIILLLRNTIGALIAVCALIGLLGCQPAITPVARATPLVLHVQITPALDRLRPAFHTCAAQEALGLTITSLPAAALDPTQTDLALRWSAPSETQSYAAVLAYEALTFIVHPDNPRTSITRAELVTIYTGRQPAGETHAWAYPGGDDVQQAFETSVLQGPPEQALPVFVAPDPAAMLEAVAQDPAALGFLPAGWLNEDVRALAVSDLSAEQSTQPVLALSLSEPQGAARGWLLCLQEQLAQTP